jgi:hypothetical protein
MKPLRASYASVPTTLTGSSRLPLWAGVPPDLDDPPTHAQSAHPCSTPVPRTRSHRSGQLTASRNQGTDAVGTVEFGCGAGGINVAGVGFDPPPEHAPRTRVAATTRPATPNNIFAFVRICLAIIHDTYGSSPAPGRSHGEAYGPGCGHDAGTRPLLDPLPNRVPNRVPNDVPNRWSPGRDRGGRRG